MAGTKNIMTTEHTKSQVRDLKRLFKKTELELIEMIVDDFLANNKDEINKRIESAFENLRR